MKLFSQAPFFKGNLHMHTTLSDGRMQPHEAIERYRASGYDFIALTDHNLVSPEQTHQGMLVLSGVELDVSLADQCVHIVGVGVDKEAFDRAEQGQEHTPQSLIDRVREAKGCAILAHPAWSLNTVERIAPLRGLIAAEVYNTFSGEPWNSARADSTAFLDIMSTGGHLLNLVASDDAHRYTGEACNSYVMLQAASLSRRDILDALSRGAFFSSQGPAFSQIEVLDDQIHVQCSAVERVTFYSNRPWVRSRCRVGTDMTEATHSIERVDWPETFVRVELRDRFGRRAWSNPIPV